MKTPTNIRYFTKYLMDEEINKTFIKSLLKTKGKKLTIAPTGSGKTCSIVKTMQKISKEDTNKVFIIACPNRIQNLQNAKNYKITAIVGGEKVSETLTVASMVYDKANEIAENYFLTKNKEITLIIDEAHQLIYAKGFRTKAINQLLNLEKKFFNVIHLTATPRALKKCYSYDEIAIFKPYENTNNIKKFVILESDDKLSALVQSINSILENQGNVLLYLNNKNKTKSIIENLKKIYKDKKIDFIDTDNKINNTTFNSIVTDELIPEDVNILISTSVIECGTNINNTNFYPIMLIDNKSHFNVDSAVQFFARLRKEVEVAFLIYQKKDENTKNDDKNDKDNFYFEDFWEEDIVLDLDEFYEKELKEAQLKVEHINKFIENNSIFLNDRKQAEEIAKLVINSSKITSTFGKGYIYIDDEDGLAKIDIELFTKYCIEKCDTSLFNDYNKLIEALKEGIKTSSISFASNKTNSIVAKEIKEAEKKTNAEIKDFREELKINFLDSLQDDYNKQIFIEYIKADYIDKQIYINTMKNNFKDIIEALEIDKKLINSIKKDINKYEMLGTEKVLNILINSNFDDYKIKKDIYLIFNKSDESIKKIDIDYSVIRNVLDKKIQKYINDKELLVLYKTLNPRSKAKKLLPRSKEKLLKEINLIYNTSTSKTNQIKISSLKK